MGWNGVVGHDPIRPEGRVVCETGHQLIAIALPLREGVRLVAALRLFLPKFRFRGAHRREVLSGMEATAEAVFWRLDQSIERRRRRSGELLAFAR